VSLNYITLTGTLPGAGGAVLTAALSGWVADPTDDLLIPPVPDPVTLANATVNGVACGTFSLPGLMANDNADIPAGTYWVLTVKGISGVALWTQNVVLNFASGATQDISGLAAYVPATQVTGVMPLPSGTAQPGQFPVVNEAATGTAWAFAQSYQALTPLAAALGNRQFARCNIVCLGDSITEGQHVTAFDNRYLGRLRDVLRTRFPTPGLSGGGRGFLGVASSGETSFTWPSTIAGSPGSGATLGPKSQFVNLSSGATTVTWNLNGDSADINWVQVFGGGTFGWQVDGGSVTNVATGGGGTVDGKVTHVPLGSAGAHTLKVSWVSGATTSITGVTEYNGDYTSGIQVHDAGHFGWQTSNWTGVLATGTAGPAAAIAALNPAAIVICLGTNDQDVNVTPATYAANLKQIITSLKAALTAPYPAFILAMLPPRTLQSTYTYPWAQYVTQAWAIAAADTSGPGGTSLVSVMDFTMGPRIPGADTDAYGFWQSGDNVHPSNLGHQAIGDMLAGYLACA
jgi:lysophospholipase L1-like esterase